MEITPGTTEVIQHGQVVFSRHAQRNDDCLISLKISVVVLRYYKYDN